MDKIDSSAGNGWLGPKPTSGDYWAKRGATDAAFVMSMPPSVQLATDALALYGKPRITVPDALPLVRRYYALPGNSNGGSLHIVLEEPNYADGDVDYCLKHAERHSDYAGQALALVLRRMSKTQRRKLAGSDKG